jgi:hypothetical protein
MGDPPGGLDLDLQTSWVEGLGKLKLKILTRYLSGAICIYSMIMVHVPRARASDASLARSDRTRRHAVCRDDEYELRGSVARAPVVRLSELCRGREGSPQGAGRDVCSGRIPARGW